jgi:hypothetical protein
MKSPGCCQGGTHEISGLGWSKQKAFDRRGCKGRKENPQKRRTPQLRTVRNWKLLKSENGPRKKILTAKGAKIAKKIREET